MRISKVTTKKGDKGRTGLGDGSRLSKSDALIHFLGEIDELNSFVGFAISSSSNESLSIDLRSIQQDLFNIGGEAAMPNLDTILLDQERIAFLDGQIDVLNGALSPLKEFILPGGDDFCSKIHIARTICRRAERSGVEVMENNINTKKWLPYLNRLSDYFFVLARCISSEEGGDEILWKRTK